MRRFELLRILVCENKEECGRINIIVQSLKIL